jgi:hypothetical protein
VLIITREGIKRKFTMEPFPVFIEEGKKKTFAGALDWPGWCRGGKDGKSALQELFHYATRYSELMKIAGIPFDLPQNTADFVITDQVEGNATTSFGAPAIVLQSDHLPAEEKDFQRWRKILEACWQSFDDSYQDAMGKELRKGPRGGGRETRVESSITCLRQIWPISNVWPGAIEGIWIMI